MSHTTKRHLETDTAYELLASSKRRRIVSHLRSREETSLDDLVDAVAGADGASPDERRTAIALVHNHLPRLDDVGVVEYDRADGAVARGRRFEALETAAESIESDSQLALLE